MHPNHEHMTRARAGPRAALDAADRDRPPERRARGAAARLPGAAARAGLRHRRHRRAGPRPARRRGDRRPTSATWQVIETPGHAPSHVCLYQEERRILISGDHLLGRVSLYYDYGYSPDPVGEFLNSLDASRSSTCGSASPATAARSPTFAAHITANRALVAERLEGCLRGRWRERADHRVRGRPAGLRRGDHGDQRELVAERDALLPARTSRSRVARRRARAERASPSAGSSRPRLRADAHRRASSRGGDEPVFSFEFFPPKTAEGEANLDAALTRARAARPRVRLGHLRRRRRRPRGKTIDIVSRIKADYGLEAMAHFTCVGADRRRAARDARPDARRRDRQRPRAARRPAAGPGRVDEDRRRPGVLARAHRADPRRLRVRDRRGGFPETHIHATSRRGRPALPQGEGRRRRASS